MIMFVCGVSGHGGNFYSVDENRSGGRVRRDECPADDEHGGTVLQDWFSQSTSHADICRDWQLLEASNGGLVLNVFIVCSAMAGFEHEQAYEEKKRHGRA